ncbi:putative integral membrane protein (TIGR00698 family) [Flavobacterium sp. 14A]|nr:putative integral membrane protein (TIGR00698 family) [Flavobacterium sp. 14A]
MENKPTIVHNITKIMHGRKLQVFLFVILIIVCISGYVSPPIALLLGLVVANTSGHPFIEYNHKATSLLLQFAVVGLGFGMNVNDALTAGKEGFFFTVASILSTLILGYFIGKWFAIDKKTAHLISCGTAICGGSAIAAIAPVINADQKQTSVALGVIFILNSIALFLFPVIGHALNLSQHEFGLWCAIAIHDTSSVVGAANKYGVEALQVATTVKLARALWIIPVALVTASLFKNRSSKIKVPYFIGLFIVAMLLNSYLPGITAVNTAIVAIAKVGLTVTLFLIGAGLHYKTLKSVGIKPLLQGVLLWVFIGVAALLSIIYFA